MSKIGYHDRFQPETVQGGESKAQERVQFGLAISFG
jgi:hypothetical protein